MLSTIYKKLREMADKLGEIRDGISGNNTQAYDAMNDMYKMQSIQKKWRDIFSGTELNPEKWEIVQTGAGQSISVASNELSINSGTTINSETIIRCKENFTLPFRSMFSFKLSQKIVNQEFYLEIISLDKDTKMPDGKNKASYRISATDNTNATYAVYQVMGDSSPLLDSAATNFINSQTAGYSIYEVECFCDECWFHARPLDTSSGRAASFVRHQRIPDPNTLYTIQIRVKNLGTSPASNTTMKLQMVNVVDYAELTAEITAGRGNVAAGQAMGVNVLNTVPTTLGSTTLNAGNAAGGATYHKLISAATTNATLLKNAAGRIYMIRVTNTSASIRYFKMYNKASAPTVGTDVPVLNFPMLPNSVLDVNLPIQGISFATGIGYAITGGLADNDTTVIVANEVIVNLAYA